MKRQKSNFYKLVLSGLIVIFCLISIISGCNNTFYSDVSQTGKIKIAVLWSDVNEKFHINAIPKDTSQIVITIKGEGLANPYIETITRGTEPLERKTLTLPLGSKTVTARALDSRSTVLAQGEGTAIVEVNKVKTLEITLNELNVVVVSPSPTIVPDILASGSSVPITPQPIISPLPSATTTYYPYPTPYITPYPTPYYPYYTPTPTPTPTSTPTVTSSTSSSIPSVPSNLSKSELTQTSFTLIWSSINGATSYKVYKDGALYADNVTGTSKSITGLVTDTTYSMQVSAINSLGESAKSSALSVKTLPLPPSAPTGLTNINTTALDFTLSWNAATGATSYKVYKDGIFYADVAPTSKEITGLLMDTTYSMQVSAVNESGESVKSVAKSVTTTTGKIAYTKAGKIAIIAGNGTYIAGPFGSNYAFPAWSPSTSKIVFHSTLPNIEIFTMNADGTGVTLINPPTPAAAYPVWSPDGTKIVFASNNSGTWDIWTMNQDGTNINNIITDPSLGDEKIPCWSPDGTKIAFIQESVGPVRKLYKMNSDGTGQTVLLNDVGIVMGPISWSPDGTKIAFTYDVGAGDYEIYVINVSNLGTGNLSTYPGYKDQSPTWSPDGTKIAFSSTRSLNEDIWIMDADGSNQSNITTSGADDEVNPKWGK